MTQQQQQQKKRKRKKKDFYNVGSDTWYTVGIQCSTLECRKSSWGLVSPDSKHYMDYLFVVAPFVVSCLYLMVDSILIC